MNINELINEELNVQAMQATIKKFDSIKKSLEDTATQNPILKTTLASNLKDIDAALESFKIILTKDLEDKKNKVGGESGVGTTVPIKPKTPTTVTPVVPPATTP